MRIWQEIRFIRFILKRLNRRHVDQELDAEMRSHLEMEIQANVERGMSLAEARTAAMRRFGSVALAKEDSTAVWGFAAIERLIHITVTLIASAVPAARASRIDPMAALRYE